MDLFGQPITLRYKDSNKFKTALGGFMTFVVSALLMSYFFILVKQMVKNERSLIVNSLQRQGDIAFNLDEKIILTKENFDIAISVGYIGELSEVDPEEYFSYYIS